MNDQTFNKPVGLLIQSCYIPASTRALTVTTEGSGVVWEVLKQNGTIIVHVFTNIKYCTCMYIGVFSEKVYEKMPLKMIKLHSVSITTVTVADKLVYCCMYMCMHMCGYKYLQM